MNRSQAGLDDLVSVWLNSHDIQAPALCRKKIFEFSPSYLVVSSNSDPFIKTISERLHAYLCSSEEINSNGKLIIEAEIITFNDLMKKKEIDLPPLWNQIPLDLVSPKGFQLFKTDYFYHLKMNHEEAVWRPHDLLVSFSLEKKLIKFLIAETSELTSPLHKSGALKKKGPVDWEEIADMVLMIFMRLFDFFCLHAASLIIEGKGVIMTGTSGSGKTTSALSLVQNGATLLSDELTLLSTDKDKRASISGILVDPRLFHYREGDIFSFEVPGPQKNNWEKKTAPLPDDLVSAGIHQTVKPALILFLELKPNNRPNHIVHGIDAQQAISGLLSQILDPYNSTRHKDIFETVVQLVEQCSFYRLELGKNVEQLPSCIAGLL